MRHTFLLTVLLTSATWLSACGGVDNSRHVEAIRALTSATPDWASRDPLGKRLWSIERAFYEKRQYVPAWIDGDRPSPQMKDLIQQLKLSEQHGLDPARYKAQEFASLMESSQSRWRGTRFDVAQVPDLDVRMTRAYLEYAADLLGWRRTPREITKNWLSEPQKDDLVARLEEAVATTDVRRTLEALAPSHSQYQGLKAALGLERENPSGHLEELRMNMERWRWMPRDLGERYILVNVASFQLQVMEANEPVLAMRVVVGAPDNPTPIFSDQMTYIVFSPYWNIPESILRDETLPKVAKDPEYLERNRIEVVRASRTVDPKSIDWSDESETKGLHFRQMPGPENALGLVKFIFPNHFSVYLHDTPSDELFKRENRALSHGCIRVENPIALAEYVLRDRPEWTAERITLAMHAKDEQTVRLKHPLPVHIGYWTAWVEPDGKTVTYTADPYRIDAAHARARGVRMRTE